MAGDHSNRAQIPRHISQYPPIPGQDQEDERARAVVSHHTRPSMASSTLTLPSIQDRPPDMYPSRNWDPRSSGYAPTPGTSSGYPFSPSTAPGPTGNSYSPAHSSNGVYSPGPPQHPYPLPAVQPSAQDPRHVMFSPDARAQAFFGPVPGSLPPNASMYDYSYRPEHGSPGSYPSDYRNSPGGGPVISHGQSAPRQRTSIACKYCRRRKIRCSGYANSPGGKCGNCIKMNQDCIFQPVSSTSSTAFIPVSALPGGVPPGTQLFGSYGQPLPTGPPPSYPPPVANYQATTPNYDQPLPSPTGSNNSYRDDRPDTNSRRRQRYPDDEHSVRLPPPNTFPDDYSHRRSPSSSSPGMLPLYHPSQPQQIAHHVYEERTPPPRGSPSGPPASNASGSSVMNLENIISVHPTANSIDENMLGRLNRRAK